MAGSELQLGKHTEYRFDYDASLLDPISRAEGRASWFSGGELPFVGTDIWNAYEVSWLDSRGLPQVRLAKIDVPCNSPNIIESKSMKLYFNSLNQSQFDDEATLLKYLRNDLSACAGGPVGVYLFPVDRAAEFSPTVLPGDCLDEQEVDIEHYHPAPACLRVTNDEVAEVCFHSHLLRSLCPVTGQPDWASIVIRMRGPAIDPEGLLQYIVSYRLHQDFHEQCVERIFSDIQTRIKPLWLEVYARYLRRGGIDINPWRSSRGVELPPDWRGLRQ